MSEPMSENAVPKTTREDQPSWGDIDPMVVESTAEYYRITQFIQSLEPDQQYEVLKRVEPCINDPVLKQFHQSTLAEIAAQITSQHGTNSVSAAFKRIYRKNPTFVAVACLAVLALVFKLGQTVVSTINYVQTNGFWGGFL